MYLIQFLASSQNFEGGQIEKCDDLDNLVRVTTPQGYRTLKINFAHSPNYTLYKESYSIDNSNREVYLVSHGMNNSSADLANVSDTIRDQKQDSIVLSIDWSGSQSAIGNPNTTDEWIRPTAKIVADKLKRWGLNDASKLNMVGHSIGSIMINEIAKAFGGVVNSLVYLDPPNYYPGYI